MLYDRSRDPRVARAARRLPPRVLGSLLLALLAALVLPLGAGAGRAEAAAPDPLPTGWPLAGPAPVRRGFDPPDQPWGAGHRGVDLSSQVGASVLATAPGRVSFRGVLAGREVLVVTHGSVRTTYEPVSAVVALGTQVQAGQVIGRLAAGSHCAGGPCLHWGLKQGQRYLDPLGSSAADRLQASGDVQLLPASARARAQRRAAARAAALAAQRAAEAAVAVAGGGRSGFLAPVPGRVTSAFGRRFHPVLKVWKLHDGTDLGAGCGTPIRAPAAGVVRSTSSSQAYGQRLFLDHQQVGGRHVVTAYNHASSYVVRAGTRVSRGQLLGYVGSTGYATGCHLHLMVWLDGHLTNPMSWW